MVRDNKHGIIINGNVIIDHLELHINHSAEDGITKKDNFPEKLIDVLKPIAWIAKVFTEYLPVVADSFKRLVILLIV